MMKPGRIHTIILSTTPIINRQYVRREDVKVDSNLRDVGIQLLNFLKDENITYVTLKNNNVVEGKSWEMAAVEASIGNVGTYSGTVEEYDGEMVTYGEVPGLHIKRKLDSNVKSVKDIKGRLLSR